MRMLREALCAVACREVIDGLQEKKRLRNAA